MSIFLLEKNKMITQERLKELLYYDPETGIFTWKVNRGSRARAGSQAGTVTAKGYTRINVDGSNRYAHRLAWLYVHGVWPVNDIDHRNEIKCDNRIVNLRDATRKENMENTGTQTNNLSGFRGVSFHRPTSKWRADIKHHGKRTYLGLFPTPEEASAAYQAARDKLFTHHKKEEQ